MAARRRLGQRGRDPAASRGVRLERRSAHRTGAHDDERDLRAVERQRRAAADDDARPGLAERSRARVPCHGGPDGLGVDQRPAAVHVCRHAVPGPELSDLQRRVAVHQARERRRRRRRLRLPGVPVGNREHRLQHLRRLVRGLRPARLEQRDQLRVRRRRGRLHHGRHDVLVAGRDHLQQQPEVDPDDAGLVVRKQFEHHLRRAVGPLGVHDAQRRLHEQLLGPGPVLLRPRAGGRQPHRLELLEDPGFLSDRRVLAVSLADVHPGRRAADRLRLSAGQYTGRHADSAAHRRRARPGRVPEPALVLLRRLSVHGWQRDRRLRVRIPVESDVVDTRRKTGVGQDVSVVRVCLRRLRMREHAAVEHVHHDGAAARADQRAVAGLGRPRIQRVARQLHHLRHRRDRFGHRPAAGGRPRLQLPGRAHRRGVRRRLVEHAGRQGLPGPRHVGQAGRGRGQLSRRLASGVRGERRRLVRPSGRTLRDLRRGEELLRRPDRLRADRQERHDLHLRADRHGPLGNRGRRGRGRVRHQHGDGQGRAGALVRLAAAPTTEAPAGAALPAVPRAAGRARTPAAPRTSSRTRTPKPARRCCATSKRTSRSRTC